MKRIIVTSVLLCCAMLMADFKLDNVFSSNMVLQRGVPVSFFGTGTPGTKVKADFKGKTVEASVDAEGNWKAEFPAAEADHDGVGVGIAIKHGLPHLRGYLNRLVLLADRHFDKLGLLESGDTRHDLRQAVGVGVLVD